MGVGGVSNTQLTRDVRTQVWLAKLYGRFNTGTGFPYDDRDIAIEKIELWFTVAGSGALASTLSIGVTIPSPTVRLVDPYAIDNSASATAVGTIITVPLTTNFDGITGDGGVLSYHPIIPAGSKLRMGLTPGDLTTTWEADLQIYWRYLDMNLEASRG